MPLFIESPAHPDVPPAPRPLAPGAVVLPGFGTAVGEALLDTIASLAVQAPFRHMCTPGGRQMSVGMTNCGQWGWISDRQGYRYSALDPDSDRPWPELPAFFLALATTAATAAGFTGFTPNACLINRYAPGTQLSLHQDKDERDFTAPIVSVSLGLSAMFLFGGTRRAAPAQRVPLAHGDVVVWGGPARLFHHGISPLAKGCHPLTGGLRFNLTFRRAG